MGQFKAKTVNTNRAWSNTLRLKVNETVEHLGSLYQSLTGVNTEPGTDNNWIHVGISDNSLIVHKTGNETISGVKTFNNTPLFNSGSVNIKDDAFGTTSEIKTDDNVIYYGNLINTNIFAAGLGFIQAFNDIGGSLSIKKNTIGNTELIVPDSNGTIALESYVDNATGWEQVNDTTYTSVSPLVVLNGVTGKILNNGGTRITTQLPTGIAKFWDESTNKLLGVNNGDAFTLSLRFKAKMNVASGLADIDINIGGSLGAISNETILFSKGSGVEQKFDIDMSYFTGTTFIANGGSIEVTPIKSVKPFTKFSTNSPIFASPGIRFKTTFLTLSKFAISKPKPTTKAPIPVATKAILNNFIAPVEVPTTVL